MNKIVVIGGGPAGMMAAIKASEQNSEVILIEKNDKLGKKLFITGKGRCNVTNSKDISEFFEYIPVNSNFLYSSLYTFTNEDTINFFEALNVPLKVERGGRVFPKSDKSSDIIKAFSKKLTYNNVKVITNTYVKSMLVENNYIKKLILNDNKEIYGDKFIFATGGASYPQTGSTGESFKYFKNVGHNIVTPKASLVPIEIKEDWIKELQGLSLKNVSLSIKNSKNKSLYTEFGEMIFTHFGISGPIVLSASCVVNKENNLKAAIDLKPALNADELDKRIQKDFIKYSNKDFKNALNELLPRKLIDTIIQLSNIDENKKVNSITKDERKALVNVIKNLEMTITKLRPIDEAIVTSGGINVKEIDPSTMQSKIINNLYFAGEMIDVDAYTGGYNIQIAISTGYLAGMCASE